MSDWEDYIEDEKEIEVKKEGQTFENEIVAVEEKPKIKTNNQNPN